MSLLRLISPLKDICGWKGSNPTLPVLTGTLPKYDVEFFHTHQEFSCRIWGGLGQGLASTANSTRAIFPPRLKTINSNGRLLPADRPALDSHLRTPTTRRASSYA